MADTRIDTLEIKITADSDQATAELDKLTASLQRMQTTSKNVSGLQSTSRQINSLGKTPSLSKLERELARVEKQAVKDGDSLLSLQRRLEDLQQYKGIGNPLTQADTAAKIKETEAQIQELSKAVDTADAKIRELRQSIKDVQAGNIPTVQTSKTSTTSKQAQGAPITQAAAEIRQAAAATQGVGNAAAQVKSNLDSASKSAENFGKQVKKATSSGSGGFAYLARSIKGMVVNFALFGVLFSLTNSIGDSFARMAQESEGVNQTLSEIKSSLQLISDALASAIFPIIQALAPIITTILDGLAGILNLLARIIAFFTGQDSVLQAQKQQVDFAGSLDNTASSMDGITAAAKKMYRALLPIDELNILEDSDAGGGTIGGLGDLRFEEVAVDPIKLPDTIASPQWSPNPVPAPAFETVTVPAWAGALVPSPEWDPDPVPSPVFATLALPEWLTEPIPAPEWATNPIPAPAINVSPALSGLLTMQEAFAYAWDEVSNRSTQGATAFEGILIQLEGGVDVFATDAQEKLAGWALATQGIFSEVSTYMGAIMPQALSGVSTAISGFVSATAGALALWGENVGENVRTTMQYIMDTCATALSAAGTSFSEWISTTSSNFASWAKNVIINAGSAAKGLFDNIVSGLSAAWSQFVGFMKGIGEKISGWWNANKSWAAPLAGAAIAGITIGAIVLSGGSALAAAPALAAIPALANGGVLTSPTTVLAGEYPGAKSNPEIVTPQSLMYDTFRDAQNNDDVVNAIMAGVQQIVRAIEENGGDIYVEADGTATQNRKNRMYGKTLQYI